MMDKNREAFEAELVKWWPQAEGNIVRDGDDYANNFMSYAWWGWRKSRSVIEVELPTKLPEEELTNLSYNLGLEHAAVAIKYVGIRVKGNEE